MVGGLIDKWETGCSLFNGVLVGNKSVEFQIMARHKGGAAVGGSPLGGARFTLSMPA